VVGVVGDVRHHGLGQPPSPELFRPTTQFPQGFGTLVIRTAGDPASLIPAVRQEIRRLDAQLPVPAFSTMKQRISAAVALPRLYNSLFTAFAAMALLLAMVGIYGVTAYSVNQRTREVGIRAALGGAPGTLLALILKQAALVMAAGMAIGLLAAVLTSRVLGSLLYGLSPTDPFTYLAVALLLAACTLLAAYFPARRAAKVDPMVALRTD
jgi:putative ABC transport system permease protein